MTDTPTRILEAAWALTLERGTVHPSERARMASISGPLASA
jgi:hypothetical protein